MARAYGSIEPDTSTRKISLRGTVFGVRQARSIGCPPVRIAWCSVRRRSIVRPSCDGAAAQRAAPRRGRRDALDHGAGPPQLVGAEAREVLLAQQLVGRVDGRDRQLLLLAVCVRIGVARLALGLVRVDFARVRAILRGHVELHDGRPVRELDARRALPERREGGVEGLEIVTARHDRAAQRVVDLVAIVEAHRVERAQAVLQPAGADLEAALAQDPPERDELAHDRVADAPLGEGLRHRRPASPRRRAPAGPDRGSARGPRGT